MKHIIRVLGLLSAILIIVVGLNIFVPSIVPEIIDLSGPLSKHIYKDTQGPETTPGQDGIDSNFPGSQTDVPIEDKHNLNTNNELLSKKYFRSKLNDKEVSAYDTIYQAVEDGIDKLNIKDNNIEKDTLIDVFNLYRMDCPEHYWIENINIQYQKKSQIVADISFVYNSTLESRAAYDKQIEAIVDDIIIDNYGSSEYEKVKYVHDYIVVNTSYDKASVHNQNIISVFINNSSVCAGYAKATQYLLNRMGIQCIYVNGISKGEGHAWNIVKIDDSYYNLDTTWDDPIVTEGTVEADFSKYIGYRYFLITDERLSKTHEQYPLISIELPVCSSTRMDYFVKENLLFDRLDASAVNTIANKLFSDIIRGERPEFISFKFDNSQAYSSYIDNLANNWFEIASIVNTRLGNDIIDSHRSSYFSTENDDNIVGMIILYN